MFSRTQPHRSRSRAYPRQAGFGLVEIMVGMLIGMIGIVVMMQVFSLAEGQKRTTTGGSDAQTNGAIAMYGLQRDLRLSGYGGITDMKMLGCDLTLPSGVVLSRLAPVVINPPAGLIPAGDANTDTLLIIYGNSDSSAQGDVYVNTPTVNTATTYTMTNPPAFLLNDYVIAVPWSDAGSSSTTNSKRPPQGTACSLNLVKVTGASVAAAGTTIVSAGLSAGMTMGQDSVMFNLGPQPRIMAYAVRNGNLTVCKFIDIDPVSGVNNGKSCNSSALTGDPTVWVPVASNIVSLRAQYGRDTTVGGGDPSMDGVVDIYEQTQPPLQSTAAASPTASCSWARIGAIRLAMTARNAQYDQSVVTTAAPTWAGTAGAPINLTATTNPSSDWQHYRYRVFETTVPLRNINLIDLSQLLASEQKC